MGRLAIILCLTLAGCASTAPLKLLTGGGGPTVNSNAQIGSENTQQVVAEQNDVTAGRDVTQAASPVQASRVETVEIVNERVPPWVILLLLLGWLAPTPSQIGFALGGWVLALFRRDRDVQAVAKKPRQAGGGRREPRLRREDGDHADEG